MNSTPVQGYSFYLNVVVLSSKVEENGASPVSTKAPEETSAAPSPAPASAPEPDKKRPKAAGPKDVGGMMDALSAGLTKRVQVSIQEKKNAANPLKLGLDGRKVMETLGTSVIKSSSSLSNSITKNARQFVSTKTMVARAEKGVAEVIPQITKEIGVEMSIRKRYQQGPVFVLDVDMKGCDLSHLLAVVLSEETAEKYRTAAKLLKEIGMVETNFTLEKEILPEIRKGLMTMMSTLVPKKIRELHSDLEIQCIALEDAEEAKWLYNFLEFTESMKQ